MIPEFVGEKFTCIVYVDDPIFLASNKYSIHNLENYFRDVGVDLEQEDDTAGFLGVTLEREIKTGMIEIKQTGLMQRVIEAVGLDDGMTKGKFTPSYQRPLFKDTYG